MRNKVVRSLIYVTWALFSLLVCIYLTFPTDTLADVLRAQLEARLGHRYQVRLDDLSLAGLTGITVEQLWLTPIVDRPATSGPDTSNAIEPSDREEAAPSPSDSEGESESPESPLPRAFPTRIDRATVTLGLISLIKSDPEVSFEIEVGDGVIYGSWEVDEESEGGHQLDVSADDVQLNAIGLISEGAQALVTGTLTGHITLQYNQENRLYGGEVHFIDIENLTRLPGPLDLGQAPIFLETPTRFGRFHAEAVLEGSDLDIRALETSGGEVQLTIPRGGRFSIRSPLMESFLRITVQLVFDEEWIRQNDLESAFRNLPLLRRSCDQGQCAMAITGPLSQIQTQPLRTRRDD